MEKNVKAPQCPHCGKVMSKWLPPAESSWGNSMQYICFNDECPYYQKGWEWMANNYNHNISYRHRYDPVTGETGPMPVWSDNALRNMIIE